MKLEKLVGDRFKERPSDCVIDSHALMLRGGYMKSVANGIYSSYMPLRRITHKIETIIRQEMDAIDGQEVQFPVVMPASLWEESGRYESIGSELLRFEDRSGGKYVLGMTHEEAAVHLVREYGQTYTKYPFMIYQIQTKFRDEARPRGGLIRVREFTMKDAYSFHLTQEDLEESIEVVIAGYQKKNAILTDKEKHIVAYHEIGHALVAAKQSHSAPVEKITIVPRTSGALGYTMQIDEGNHYLMSKEEIENKIATLTGGRAAEETQFGSITTGASNDIEQATKLARAMITQYGMSSDFDMVAMETVNNQYLGGDTSLSCSPQTQQEIDRAVVEIVRKQHKKACEILEENREKLDELAKYLYEKETITGEEFMHILKGNKEKETEGKGK